MNLPSYDIILKIAEVRSLSRTAEYFSYTPSRISQILKAAEEELGVPLFLREKSGLVPTVECEALLPALRELLNSEKCFREQLSRVKNVEAGTVRIGSFTSLSCHWLPQRLRLFGERWPHIQFELKLGSTKEIADWTRSGKVDLGLTTDPESPELEFIQLMEDRFVVVLPERHPLAGGQTAAAAQLEGENFLFLEPEDNGIVEDYLRREGFQPRVRYRVRDDYTVMALVECGLGVSILPELVLRRSPYRIAALELSPPCLRRTGIVLRRDGRVPPATRRLVEFWQESEGRGATAGPAEEPTHAPGGRPGSPG